MCVIVISPHPDDETLGCGGTLLRHKAEGKEIHWVIMTKISEESGYTAQEVKSRNAEIRNVSNEYGFSSVNIADFDTTTLDYVPKNKLIQFISKVFYEVQPNIVYMPFLGDAHSDHLAVFEAVSSCTKSFRYPFIKKVRAYEVLSETEFGIYPDRTFKPNLWIDIGIYFEKKIEIMKIYENEMGSHPFPRSEEAIKALATIRGIVAGVESAESFMSLKEIL
jgi:LmbE family N-acetylglucosaminyl deacetylase